jgi:hypothetical protein
MDLFHISLRYDSYKSLQEFIWNPRIHATSPLDLSAQIYFGSSCHRDSTVSVLKLKPHYNFPGVHDLLTSVHLQIDEYQLFISLSFRCFNASPLPSSRSHNPTDTYPSRSNGPYFLRLSDTSRFKNLNFQTHSLLS